MDFPGERHLGGISARGLVGLEDGEVIEALFSQCVRGGKFLEISIPLEWHVGSWFFSPHNAA